MLLYWLLIVFLVGYGLIVAENVLRLNKAATALLSGMGCWLLLSIQAPQQTLAALPTATAEIASIVFFLIGAMTIVEVMDAHDAFEIIALRLQGSSPRKLLIQMAILVFFLSALLDNLTTTILFLSIIRRIVTTKEQRWLYAGIIIIAANAGGAWSPMGDVTTTMLWIAEKVSTVQLIAHLFIPALIALLIPLWWISRQLKETQFSKVQTVRSSIPQTQQILILCSGLLLLISVPFLKTITHLPPYVLMLMNLAVLWVLTEVLHFRKSEVDKGKWSVSGALQKIDIPSVLFFTGILYGVAALEQANWLHKAMEQLNVVSGDNRVTATALGVFSAIIDNVPLVAASIKMFPAASYPNDSAFWQLLAFTTGTGGSLLIIGSAAGVAAMGMEELSFTYYLKKFTLPILLGFLGGVCYLMLI